MAPSSRISTSRRASKEDFRSRTLLLLPLCSPNSASDRTTVGERKFRPVTGGTRHRFVARKPRVKEQLPPQFDRGGSLWVVLRDWQVEIQAQRNHDRREQQDHRRTLGVGRKFSRAQTSFTVLPAEYATCRPSGCTLNGVLRRTVIFTGSSPESGTRHVTIWPFSSLLTM